MTSVYAELTLSHGATVGHGAVAMLMQRAALEGLPGNRRRHPAAQVPTAPTLIARGSVAPTAC
ncbi:hypothetical protein [Nonomuraea insulae]|uniref:Uncharacterized protein n=1 Tax=Nonomuraea insulae TaxID=1616787 RepID=A0ABW1CC59_9ACTN